MTSSKPIESPYGSLDRLADVTKIVSEALAGTIDDTAREALELEILVAAICLSRSCMAILNNVGTPRDRALARSKTDYLSMLREALHNPKLLPMERSVVEVELGEALEIAGYDVDFKRAMATVAFVARSRSEYPS